MERSELAKHIRALREYYCKETQQDFADRLKLSRVAITRYETNARIPRKKVLNQMKELASEHQYVAGEVAFSSTEQTETEQLRAQLETARKAIQTVHDKFTTDQEQGYRTRDKQYAIDILGLALAQIGAGQKGGK